MTKLELRAILSPDAEPDEWQPSSGAVWILLQLEIGAYGEPGCDTFDVMVATPEGLARCARPDSNGVLSRRALIVINEFSWSAVRRAVSDILASCAAST